MRISIIALLMSVVGCGGDDTTADPYQCAASGGAACFELPTARVEAADPVSFASKAPVLACPTYEITTSPAPINFNGRSVRLYGGMTTVSVRFEIFQNLNLTGSLLDVTSDDGSVDPDLAGTYAGTVDTGMPSQVFMRTSRSGFLPLVFLYERFDVNNPQYDNYMVYAATRDEVELMLQGVGDSFLMSKTQLVGRAVDCAGNNLVNVIVNVSTKSAVTASRDYEVGVRTYYAQDGLDLRLARRTMMMQTGTTGRFAASNLAAGRHYVQVWGYLTDADVAKGSTGLSLLAEQEIIATTIESAQFMTLYGAAP